MAGYDLIRVAVTRTPEQAVPISGQFIGEANDAPGLAEAVDGVVSPLPGEVVVASPEPAAQDPPPLA